MRQVRLLKLASRKRGHVFEKVKGSRFSRIARSNVSHRNGSWSRVDMWDYSHKIED